MEDITATQASDDATNVDQSRPLIYIDKYLLLSIENLAAICHLMQNANGHVAVRE
jgi:hypothetical protein